MDGHEDVRGRILARAARVGGYGRSGGGLPAEQVMALLRAYYAHVAVEDLAERDPVDVYGAAMSHYRLAAARSPGTAAVRVSTPTVEEHGWSSRHTVVEVVSDDMPFLVDSVTMELSRQGRGLHLVVHPQLVVRRDPGGRVLAVRGSEGTGADRSPGPDGQEVPESWIHVEIDRETEPASLARIETALRAVLADVRSAVQDWQPMRSRALDLAAELGTHPPAGLPAAEVEQTRELLRWLAEEHFTFLGYREYALQSTDAGGPEGEVLRAIPGSGLGILRAEPSHSRSFAQLAPEARVRARAKELLVLTKANSRATVHRPAYLDYIGIKTFDAAGEVAGERRFLGLFTSVAYSESVHRIPVLRQKAAEVLRRSGFGDDSHSGKALQDILEHYPRAELFQVSVPELLDTVTAILHLQERRRLRIFVRKDVYGRFVSVLVYLPRDRFSTQVRLRLQDILLEAYGGQSIDFELRFSESVLARLHFVVRLRSGTRLPDVDLGDLQRRLAATTRTWSDDFGDALLEQVGEERAAALARTYADAFPAAYQEDFPARVGVADLQRLVALRPDGDLGLSLYEPVDAGPNERRFKIYRTGTALSLARILPLLTDLGVEVVDERPYEIEPRDQARCWVYDFGLRYDDPSGTRRLPDNARELFQSAFAAVWSGDCESDGFNALVLRAGLAWRQVAVLRAYAKYLRQAGSTFSQDYIEDALVANPDTARLLVELFETRLDPRRWIDRGARDAATEELVGRIDSALDDVASLDQDRIIRSLRTLVRTTLRTNYFRERDAALADVLPCLSFKLDAAANPELPRPRPRYEIWVYAPRVEGVHLRFGPVARGGLRWSDRREDFRTEVLGLAKAQMVKNALIVPVGAKGGFFCKRLPDPMDDREGWWAEGVACYRAFVAGLLDLTDNREGGRVVPPPDVVRHDGDDPYLVVAADKGTASLSDVANEIAVRYGYWLGDAFASGGSTGYDHKALGITARGAWESVRRHFAEMGLDPNTQDFTCVGIGDMSGDVFGNGMLRSEHIRLVAAFDHRHVFCDPDPDPTASYAERRRLFELPRSGWGDYDPDLISPGGGVFSRTAKSVRVSEQLRAALGMAEDVTEVTPNDLVRAILTAPVDLLWNGGIGTFVKATGESHADVGDKGNDAVRVDAAELRCRCVAEGGNLGFTQLARIEYASDGGRINTDSIDNSAGVDLSDHEVNIKILLDGAVADGELTTRQRNELLARMADEVTELVLRDNVESNLALQTESATAAQLVHVHADWIRRLERAGKLDRDLEFLPTARQLRERQAVGRGLTVPEAAVLMAHTKIVLTELLLASDLPDDPFPRRALVGYFPMPLRERFTARMDRHPLRREIVAAQIVNRLVTTAGLTFYPRLSQEAGAAAVDLTRAHLAAREIIGTDRIWVDVERLDVGVDPEIRTRLWLVARTVTERAARWLVQHRRPLDVTATVDVFAAGMARLRAAVPDLVRGPERATFEAERDALVAAGVDEALATTVAALPPLHAGFGVLETAHGAGEDLLDVAEVHFELGERLGLGGLLERIVALPRRNRWETTARAGLRDDLYDVHSRLTAAVLAASPAGKPSAERIDGWEQGRAAGLVGQTRIMLGELVEGDRTETADLARLTVGLRLVRRLLA